jgi:glycosyltransferase involved in cell wall biosynthesis
MKFFLSFIFFSIISVANAQEPIQTQKICLNMIVKNESAVIERCLNSVKPFIDYWVIVDTGSSDDTKERIQSALKNIPGELHERPWIDFGHNRNEALELAKDKADYVLILDADETLDFEKNFKFPCLNKDFYYIKTDFAGTVYYRSQLINNHLNWKWVGVLHEVLICDQMSNHTILEGVKNVISTDGARSQDPQKFQKDVAVLEKALLQEPTNSRYVFYLAQSYRDAQLYEPALQNYAKRASMGGWDQEVFWSLLQVGLLSEELKKDSGEIAHNYLKAFIYRPSRIEPLYRLANFFRLTDNHLAGYEIAKKGLTIRNSTDILFVEKWIYDYGLLLEFSVCAYWVEKYTEALLASYLILSIPNLPNNVTECVERNLVWIHSKLKELNPPTVNQEVSLSK